jgi:hypothetical protein
VAPSLRDLSEPFLGVVFASDKDGAPGEVPNGGKADCGDEHERNAQNGTGLLTRVLADSSWVPGGRGIWRSASGYSAYIAESQYRGSYWGLGPEKKDA